MSQHHRVQESLPTESPTLLFGPKIDTSFRSLPASVALAIRKTRAGVGVRPRHDGGVLSAVKFSGVKTLCWAGHAGQVWQVEGDAGGVAGDGHSFVHSFMKHLLSKYYVSDTGSGDGCSPAPGSPGTLHPAGEKYITQTVPAET